MNKQLLKVVSKNEKVIQMIQDDLPNYLKYFDDSGERLMFKQRLLVKDILDNHSSFFNNGRQLFRYSNGVYKSDGANYFRKLAQELLDEESTKSRIEEALYWLSNNTYQDNFKVNPDDGFINVMNGIVNIKTGDLLPHDPNRISTIQLPVEYNPEAKDPNVVQFIKSIVDKESRHDLTEMIGYTLIPNTKFEKAFMLTGTGANGKSTFINMISAMLGKNNISNVPLQDFEKNRFKTAQLYHKLANIFADISPEALDKSSIFKSIVSGDAINVEFKGKDSFNFRPFAKLIFSANEIPLTKDVSDGFFRRWIIIPFPNKFTPDKADPNLIHKLTTPEALSTLLNIAIKGYKRLTERGYFSENESTKKLLEEYKKDSDTVLTFMNECCEIENGWGETVTSYPTPELFNFYSKWCNKSGMKPVGKVNFNKRLENEFNLAKKKAKVDGKVKEVWQGLIVNE